MGIHMEGNQANVDSLGFVNPTGGFSKSKNSHIFTRIMGNPRIKNSLHWRQVENCWVCEKWVEVEFVWTPGVSGLADADPMYLHLDFEDFSHDLMEKQPDGTFTLVRMVPPKRIRFFYSADGVPAI
jgi:hypothetical protein